jgi:hypothetical protein
MQTSSRGTIGSRATAVDLSLEPDVIGARLVAASRLRTLCRGRDRLRASRGNERQRQGSRAGRTAGMRLLLLDNLVTFRERYDNNVCPVHCFKYVDPRHSGRAHVVVVRETFAVDTLMDTVDVRERNRTYHVNSFVGGLSAG